MTWGRYWQTPANQGPEARDERRYYQYAMGLPYSQSTQNSDDANDVDQESKDDEGECESCSQRSRSSAAEYGQNDYCKRHRKKDDQQYTEQVVAYKRRRPIS